MEFPNDADESEQRKLKELLTKALPIPPDAGIIIYPNQMGGQSPDKHKRKLASNFLLFVNALV